MSKGFTLVEVLMVIAVFAVLMVAGTTFFLQVVQNSNQAATQTNVRQGASAIMQELTRAIRNSACVSWQADSNFAWPYYGLNSTGSVFITTYSDSCGGTVANKYWFVFDTNHYYNPGPPERTMQSYDSDPGTIMDISGKVLKWENGSFVLISPNNIAVMDCGTASKCGTGMGCGNGLGISGGSTAVKDPSTGVWSTTGAVNMSLTVQATVSATRPDFCAQVVASDSATPRL
ncbi:prepilin-type N-terminal cleavage/methylation domain-containing protein [Candidatus Microgenomates bacterium]|nr:prepilin-type N-terminal cleavage/methylation domain-containing protein [Candidatus Microgenomates bacterium]